MTVRRLGMAARPGLSAARLHDVLRHRDPQQLLWMKRLVGIACILTVTATLSAHAEDRLQFNRDIRPILTDQCFSCHGPDSAARKADLRLDQRDAALAMKAFVPGQATASEAIRRILSTDPDEQMPPPASKKHLTDHELELLRRWINEGAEYQLHWAFLPPAEHPLPAVKNEAWCRSPIDRFILAKMEANGLSPAPEADRRTLARRLSFDLNGLPPDPAMVEQFVASTDPNAYELLVDELLASPRWGEHRGRYWLDYARYADTHGIHFDNMREMWSYRDEVIKAFNRNQPFDEFTIEQLAGDLLPNRTLEQQVASGFNRCNMTTNEGGAIPEEYLVLYTRDRTETTSAVWLGLTAGCAVCHDHKFDPLSQKEFYELSAFFNNTTQNAMDGNIRDTPPVTPVPVDADRARWEALPSELTAARGAIERSRQQGAGPFGQWVATAATDELNKLNPTEGQVFHARLSEGSGRTVSAKVGDADKSQDLPADIVWTPGKGRSPAMVVSATQHLTYADVGNFDGKQAFSYGCWVKLPHAGYTGAALARMDDLHGFRGWDLWMEADRIGAHIINQWPGNAVKVVANAGLPINEWHHVQVTWDGSGKPAGLKVYYDGKVQATTTQSDSLNGTIATDVPFTIGQRFQTSAIADAAVQDVRIYARELTAAEVEKVANVSRLIEVVAKPADQRSEAENAQLFDWWLAAHDDGFRNANARVTALTEEQAAIRSRGTIAFVMQEKNDPAMAFVLFRGEYDKRRDETRPGTPAVLPAFPSEAPRNRLGLAKWLLEKDNPLTARVTVNRFWQEVFGAGIVRTAGDFGITGEYPSHPELLDWLAIDFRDHGWDVKRLFKTLVCTSTYRQSAVTTPEKLENDPSNRLVSRGPRFRMDAEVIRDMALAASGLLSSKIGGPSVRPYQPQGVWEAVAMRESNTSVYQQDHSESLYRRSLYTFWKRAAPPASMDVMNAPSREVCTVRRERTNTPLQALLTLNDVQFIEAARVLAELAVTSSPDDKARANLIGGRLLSRPFTPSEYIIVDRSLGELRSYYKAHPDDAKQLLQVGERPANATLDPAETAAWTMLANECMNLDEALNK